VCLVSHSGARQAGQRHGAIRAAGVGQTIILNFAAQSETATVDDITRRILETVPKDEKLN